MRLRERIGVAIGRFLAPAVAAISRRRRARMFHPRGLTFVARISPIPSEAFGALAIRLSGDGLFRASAALAKRERSPDVLGVALRLPGDQDLLLATIRSPFTMPFALFATAAHDFFANQYWAVSPFDVDGIGPVKLRLRPASRPAPRGSRDETLRAAVDAGDATWILEARHTFRLDWTPIARIDLLREAAVDQEALRFSPYRDGLGITPRGLVHAIRRTAYPASQRARPDHAAPAQMRS